MKFVALMAFVLALVWVLWLAGDTIETQDDRITQLECALAQAHATADSLEVMLEPR